jgi:hypothetical protein
VVESLEFEVGCGYIFHSVHSTLDFKEATFFFFNNFVCIPFNLSLFHCYPIIIRSLPLPSNTKDAIYGPSHPLCCACKTQLATPLAAIT